VLLLLLLLLLLTTVYVMPIPATSHSGHSSNVQNVASGQPWLQQHKRMLRSM
jgi:hypothetical protein